MRAVTHPPDLGLPARGRVVTGRRTVRMAEVGPDRRARLDAIARYLHDVAEDDAAGAALPATLGWVLRSTEVDVGRFPTLGEDLVLHTYCSATASRWAERTTVVGGSDGASLRAVSIWVAVHTETGAPTRLDDTFFAVYGPSADGRRASARLTLAAPGRPEALSSRSWPLRRSDFDAWGHVNNAIAWAAMEDAISLGPADSVAIRLEHHAPIDPDADPALAFDDDGEARRIWLLRNGDPASVLVSARVLLRRQKTASIRRDAR